MMFLPDHVLRAIIKESIVKDASTIKMKFTPFVNKFESFLHILLELVNENILNVLNGVIEPEYAQFGNFFKTIRFKNI